MLMVTESRIRVLRAYRREREQGLPPAQAMRMVQRVADRMVQGRPDSANDLWDYYYSSRYLKIITQKMWYMPYWEGSV